MKFSIKDFSSKYDQNLRKLQIWSNLLEESLMKNFIFLCSVFLPEMVQIIVFNTSICYICCAAQYPLLSTIHLAIRACTFDKTY